MYKNHLEIKKNIDSLNWSKEEKVTDRISRRRLINNGSECYAYKYYKNSDQNNYIVMISKKGSFNIVADAIAFGVKNGVATDFIKYLNNDYIHRDNYFKDALLDELGNTAIKDFKLGYQRKQERTKNDSLDKYKVTLTKEFVEKLKPEIIKIAKDNGFNLTHFRVTADTPGAIFPYIDFNLEKPLKVIRNSKPFEKVVLFPVHLTHELHGKKEYFSELRKAEPDSKKGMILYRSAEKLTDKITKLINDTLKERTSNLMKDPNGLNLRINTKSKDEEEGRAALKGSTLKLRYEEYVPNYFNY